MSHTVPDPDNTHPFDALTPEVISAAIVSTGLMPDGRLLPLNSYENRVYQAGIDDSSPVIAKFYRPQRWTTAAIHEEHRFALELNQTEIPVVAPLVFAGHTLLRHGQFWFAIFPRQGGRWPELTHADDWQRLGRFLGRIHLTGGRSRFAHRASLSVAQWGAEPRNWLLKSGWIPEHLQQAYRSITDALLQHMRTQWQEIAPGMLRIHGDCHLGNVLWTEAGGPHFVDLDDTMMGPALQDLWMLLSGSQDEQAGQLRELLAGYTEFMDFDYRELALLESLRTLRLMHYAAWLARRWDDPAFPKAFPWFAEVKYWEQHVLDLREQLAALQEPPLSLWQQG